jgi:hypothetical protein
MTTRRFPPPWRADKMPGGYVVRVPPSRVGLYGKENRSNRR